MVWRQALVSAGHPMGMRTLVPLGIAKLFADQVLPSGGISGTVLVVRGLIRRGVPPASAMAAMMAELLSFDVAYLLVVLASATILRMQSRDNLAIGVGVAIFLALMIAMPLAATLLLRGLTFWLPMVPGIWLVRSEVLRG